MSKRAKRAAVADVPTLPRMEMPAALRMARRRGGRVSDYTGADIARVWPDGHAEVLRLLGEGVTISAIAERLQLSRNTVAGIRDNAANRSTLEQQRAQSAGESRSIAALARDRQRELLIDPSVKFKARDLPALTIAAQQAEDMAERLTGGVSVRVEHVHKVADDDFEQVLRAAKRAAVINTHPGEERGALLPAEAGAAGGDGDNQARADRASAGVRASNVLSDVSGLIPAEIGGNCELSQVVQRVAGDLLAGSDVARVVVGSAQGVGGEGVARAAGAEMPNGKGKTEFSDIDSGTERFGR